MAWCWPQRSRNSACLMGRPTFGIRALEDDHETTDASAGDDGHERIMGSTRDERQSRPYSKAAARDVACQIPVVPSVAVALTPVFAASAKTRQMQAPWTGENVDSGSQLARRSGNTLWIKKHVSRVGSRSHVSYTTTPTRRYGVGGITRPARCMLSPRRCRLLCSGMGETLVADSSLLSLLSLVRMTTLGVVSLASASFSLSASGR